MPPEIEVVLELRKGFDDLKKGIDKIDKNILDLNNAFIGELRKNLEDLGKKIEKLINILEKRLRVSRVYIGGNIQLVSTHRYLAPTSLPAGGTATIWSPSSGKAVRIKRIQISTDSATRIELRWGTTPFESYFLPANSSVVINFVGTNQQGETDTPLNLYSSSAATVTASVDGDEI